MRIYPSPEALALLWTVIGFRRCLWPCYNASRIPPSLSSSFPIRQTLVVPNITHYLKWRVSLWIYNPFLFFSAPTARICVDFYSIKWNVILFWNSYTKYCNSNKTAASGSSDERQSVGNLIGLTLSGKCWSRFRAHSSSKRWDVSSTWLDISLKYSPGLNSNWNYYFFLNK